MTRFLFDTPWWLPTVLIAVGIALFWNGNRRMDAQLRRVGIGLILAAVLVGLLSYFVDTDVEKAIKQSKALARAVEQRDWATLKTILSPTTTLSIAGGSYSVYANRDEIIIGAQQAVDRFGLKAVHILGTNAEEGTSLITVGMNVASEHDVTMGRPIPSSWKFEWQKTGKTWSLVHIVNISVANVSGDAAGRQFPAPK
jgi:hypothetical protein